MGRIERRQKWYAVAGPAGGVFNTVQKLGVSVEVSSREEGELLLAGGIRLEPGLFVFTDAAGAGGIGIVIVEMAEGREPNVVREEPTSVREIARAGRLAQVDPDELLDSFARMKHIVGEMVALHASLQLITSIPEGGPGSR